MVCCIGKIIVCGLFKGDRFTTHQISPRGGVIAVTVTGIVDGIIMGNKPLFDHGILRFIRKNGKQGQYHQHHEHDAHD